jgi:outer membrane protein assembly factor BamB
MTKLASFQLVLTGNSYDFSLVRAALALTALLTLAGCATPTTQPPTDNPLPTATRLITPTATPVPSATPIPPPQFGPNVILYRGDGHCSGAYDLPALRQFPDVKWQKSLGALASFGSPVFAEGVLYVGGQDGKLRAFDAETGAARWAASFGDGMSAVAVARDVIYAGTISGQVQAVDRRDGSALWSAQVGASAWGAPLVVNEVVYFTAENGVHAFEARTGQPVWKFATERYRGFVGSPAFEADTLYAAIGDTLFALDSASGQTQWQVELGASFYGLAVANDKVYLGNDDGYFYAFDRATGEQHWTFQAGTGWSAPAVADGVIYVGNIDQHLYALDARTGRELWKFEAEDWTTSDPIVADGVMYVGSGNHSMREAPRHLYALDAQTGAELWKFQAAGRILTAPALGEG